MTNEDILVAMLDALNSVGVPHMLTGSLASNLYGMPRSTQDADFVVQLTGDMLGRITGILPPSIRLDPQVSFETVTGTTRYVFEPSDHKYRIELFLLSDDPHDRMRFGRRLQCAVLGRKTWVPAPEDVLIAKLRWFHRSRRTKDLEDLRNVLSVQQDKLDWDYLQRWCQAHGTADLLQQLRQEIPPLQ
ncbi:MAG: hypothetical protein QUV05_04470 [Phycisphaerae bacterium]|nr:hypothetical protein [Phycisphaerae bacterium]